MNIIFKICSLKMSSRLDELRARVAAKKQEALLKAQTEETVSVPTEKIAKKSPVKTPVRRVSKLVKNVNYEEWVSKIVAEIDVSRPVDFVIFSDERTNTFEYLLAETFPVSNFTVYTTSVVKIAGLKHPNIKGVKFSNMSELEFIEDKPVIAVTTTEDFYNTIITLLERTTIPIFYFTTTQEWYPGSVVPEGLTNSFYFRSEEPVQTVKPEKKKRREAAQSKHIPAPVSTEGIKRLKFTFPDLENIPGPRTSKIDSESWRSEFRHYIKFILEKLVTTDERLLTDLTQPTPSNKGVNVDLIWRLAFTHNSVNPDVNGNYEQFESLGDSYLAVAFRDYMLMKYPRLDEFQLNEFKSRYMSNEFQIPLGQKLLFEKWIIVDPQARITVKINEDIFESFAGAMARIGDQIKGGLGYLLVRKMIDGIFKNIELDPVLGLGKPLTILQQRYDSLRWGPYGSKINMQVEDLGGSWRVTYRIEGKEFEDYLRNEFVVIKRSTMPQKKSIYVVVEGRGMNETKDLAAQQVMNEFSSMGITPQDMVTKDLRRDPEYRNKDERFKNLTDAAYYKANQQNIDRVYIQDFKTLETETHFYYMLVGESNDDQKILHKLSFISELKTGQPPIEVKLKLLRNFVQN